jgi:cytochrome c553
MTEGSRSFAICLLVAAGCRPAGAREEPPLTPGPSERFEHDMMVRFHMHQSFDLVRAIERLLVRGKLDDARAFARAISEAPDEPGLTPWAKQAALVRERAAAVASATTLDEACRREARLAEACASCHVDAGVVPDFRSFRPPADQPTVDARMARHLWATGRLWEGIVGGAEDSWRDGLDVLAATPLPAVQAGAQAGARADLARRLQQLAAGARQRWRTDTPADRAAAYGEMLVTCAGCHTTRPAEHAGDL